MTPAPDQASLPLPKPSLLRLLGDDFRDATITAAEPLRQRSRNHLWRLHLDAAPTPAVILKVVRAAQDRFWDHHLRREHRVLDLLARWWPGGAPRPYGAVFSDRWGLLLMEDAGPLSLAESLLLPSASRRCADAPATPLTEAGANSAGLLLAVVERVASLHEALRAHHLAFYRTCHSVDLDRMSQASLLSRLRVARDRLRGADAPSRAATLPRPLVAAYARQVSAPLLHGPRQMIHNSLSPLSVVLGPAIRLVDWETMTKAAPELDVADLLRYPGVGLSWPETDQLVGRVFGAGIDPLRLRLAALTRAIDYAGANARVEGQSRQAGDDALAALAIQRRTWYLAEAKAVAADVGVGELVADALG